jgi:FMN phosphatase YigB (HAD superfamily)
VADLLLVVDFDGTVYRGDEPVRFYARRVAESMHARAAEPFLASFESYLALGVRSADSCEDTVEAAALRESYDAWGAAVHLAQRVYKVSNEIVEAAFFASRIHMLESGCELEPVTALLDVLREVRARARCVLATNSPPEGVMPVLDLLGVTDLFDEVAMGLGKPDGLRRYLQYELGDDLRSRPWRLFSIGDHYRNEIEPAVEIGAGAGYIDRFGRADGPATAVAASAEGVLPTLLAWANDPQVVVRAATN